MSPFFMRYLIIAFLVVFEGCTTTKTNSSSQLSDLNAESFKRNACHIGYINTKRISQSGELRENINSDGFLVLTDGEVMYSADSLDLTNSLIRDNFQILSNTKKQIDEITASKCSVVSIDMARVFKVYEPAKKIKQKLDDEFGPWDNKLVEMKKSDVDSSVYHRDLKKFQDAFNQRRSQELNLMLEELRSRVGLFSSKNNYHLVATEFNQAFKNAQRFIDFTDKTDEFIKFSQRLDIRQ